MEKIECPNCRKSFEITESFSNLNPESKIFCTYCGKLLDLDYIKTEKTEIDIWRYQQNRKLYAFERGNGLRQNEAMELSDYNDRIKLFFARFKLDLDKVVEINEKDIIPDKGLLLLQTLLTCSKQRNFTNKRLAKKEIEKLVNFLNDNKISTQAWEDEVFSLVYLYFKLCLNSKNYGTFIFGFGKRKKSSIINNIWDDLLLIKDFYLDPNNQIEYIRILGETIVNALNAYGKEYKISDEE